MRTGEECSLKMDAVLENTDEKLSDFGFGIVVDVSLYSNCGVFRRYHVLNNPVNFTDALGLEPGGGPNATIRRPPPQSLSASPSSWWERGNNRATCLMRAHWEWQLCLRGESRDYDSCPQTDNDNCFDRVRQRLEKCLRNAK
jgi:hypothetical protein